MSRPSHQTQQSEQSGTSRKFGKVGVLFGGSSAERDISILSGTGVLEALKKCGVDAHGFDPATRSMAELVAEKFERVFIALHGRFGEDGTIQGALELLDIPYTGSGVMASSVAMDKIFTKRIWETHGLPTPKYLGLTPGSALDGVADTIGLPLIVKPPHEGSTIGITRVNDAAALQTAVSLAARYDDVVLAEEFIDGRELTVSILASATGDVRALPIIEIVAPDGNYDYENKYFTDATQYLCPAPIDAALTSQIQEMAVRAFNAIACSGWGRVDVMLRHADNRPYLLEVNTSPGMTGHSLVPMAAKVVGISYEELCLEILAGASLKVKRPQRPQRPQPAAKDD